MKTEKKLHRKWVNIHPLRLIILPLLILIISVSGQAQTWSLQQCIDTAQVYNKNLQISRNNMAIGSEKQQEAKANLIPKVMLNADYKYFFEQPYQLMPLTTFNPDAPEGDFKAIQFGVPHNINASVQLTMPLYNPQVYGAIKATKIASEINMLQNKKSEEQLFFEISNLYFNAQILIHQQAFIDSNLINTNKLLENLKLLHQQQMIKKSDVSKIELQKEQIETQQQIVANNYQQVLNALKFSMGISFHQLMEISSEIENRSVRDYKNMLTVDLLLANSRNRLITSELKTLKNARIPSVSLLGSYSQAGYGYSEKPNGFLDFYPVSFAGIQISYPLFNGTVTKRRINQKKIEIQNSELQVDLLEEQNSMLIENANLQRNVTQKTIKNTLGQIELANTVYEQMLLQQKEGTASLTEVLLADNALREAQQAYLSAIVEYLKADLELKKLSGNISSKN